jgi:hypothetical protein
MMSKTLGGSIFVRNAIRFGYCMTEALESLYALCDEISILECGSDDGTQELIKEWVDAKRNEPHKRIILEMEHAWDVADNYTRLAVLANVARSKLSAEWHFMLQADEVLHECSIPVIRRLIELPPMGYSCRRLNLFRSPDVHIRLDSKKKPCGDVVYRLGRTSLPVFGDAESINIPDGRNDDHINEIIIFHYGYVREGAKHIAKAIDMQSWFHGPYSQPDQRIVRMRDEGNIFRPEVFFSPDDVSPIPIPHPRFSAALAERLRGEACQ